MPRLICTLMACLWMVSIPAAGAQSSDDNGLAAAVKNAVLDSAQMEKDLQRLPWKQFRSVIEAVPKMKANVEAYGPAGWQFVQQHYATYGWKKSIDKLDNSGIM